MKRSELYAAVWTDAVSVVASRYGISDTWLRKICNIHDVPVPGRGYWQRLRAGLKVQTTELPPGADVEIDVSMRSPAARRPATTSTPSAKSADRPLRAQNEDLPRVAADDIAFDLMMIERDAQRLARTQALEAALVELSNALAGVPDLDAAAYREWLQRLHAQVLRQASEACQASARWATVRFSKAKPPR